MTGAMAGRRERELSKQRGFDNGKEPRLLAAVGLANKMSYRSRRCSIGIRSIRKQRLRWHDGVDASTDRRVRLLDQADDHKPLGARVSHRLSPLPPITSPSRRSSRVCSAPISFWSKGKLARRDWRAATINEVTDLRREASERSGTFSTRQLGDVRLVTLAIQNGPRSYLQSNTACGRPPKCSSQA